MATVYTIGHSNHELPKFIELLTAHKINMLVDVRSYPSSRHTPQFNRSSLPNGLRDVGISYQHIASLGGRRSKCCDESHNGWWSHPSFRNYADYAELDDEFYIGLTQLRTLATELRVAYMCAEAVWWKCHRRIITDYLISSGMRVEHIGADGLLTPAAPTESARRKGRSLIYCEPIKVKIPSLLGFRKHAGRQ